MKLKDLQERSFDGVRFIMRKVGAIRAQGVELEGQAGPTSQVTIDFDAAYLDLQFTENRTAPGLPACNNSETSCPTVQANLGAGA